MVDENEQQNTNPLDDTQDEKPIIDENYVNEYAASDVLISYVKGKMKFVSRVGSINLIKQILLGNIHIKTKDIQSKNKKLYQFNMGKFTKEKELKPEIVKELRLSLNGLLSELGKEIVRYDKDEHKDFEVKQIDGQDCFIVDKSTLYGKVRKLICDEGGHVVFNYDFNHPDMSLCVPQNMETLQRCQIQILSTGVKFDFAVQFVFKCTQCEHRTEKKPYNTASTNHRIVCEGIYHYTDGEGEGKSKICRTSLIPDREMSLTKDAFFYDISYEDEEGNKHAVTAISFAKYKPGFYECVLFKIRNPNKTENFMILDIKPIAPNSFVLPEAIKGENFLFTLQKGIDKYISEQTGMNVYGLYPIKVALILQCVMSHLKMELIGNVQLVGDASTGKSTVLKYYGFMLYNHLNLSTNGLSISVAGLRGTKTVINLMGKDHKIITVGHLGTYRCIHIDEAGENRDLIQNLKAFLLEANYSYDKAGATGVFNKRAAQVNVSENLDYNHLGQYRGAIRKAYKDENFQIEGEDKEEWDEKCDLHLPIYKYDNIYLKKVIEDKRQEYKQKQVFWIDGYEIPLHERFQFYFYLVNEDKNEELKKIVQKNVRGNTIKENLEVMRVLKVDSLEKFFLDLMEYKNDDGTDYGEFDKVDEILEQYQVYADARIRTFYYTIVTLSRIVNKRKKITKTDYDLLRWFLEKCNCKLDVIDTVDYKIVGPPDKVTEEAKNIKVAELIKQTGTGFGLPDGEF